MIDEPLLKGILKEVYTEERFRCIEPEDTERISFFLGRYDAIRVYSYANVVITTCRACHNKGWARPSLVRRAILFKISMDDWSDPDILRKMVRFIAFHHDCKWNG